MASHFALDDGDLELPPSAQTAPTAVAAAARARGTSVRSVASRSTHAPVQSNSAASRAMTPGVAGSSRPTPLHDENHAARRATASSSSTAPSHGRSQSQHRAAASSSSAAAPVIHTVFDPWNSGSTGHQRANNRLSGSTSWRESRNLKLGEQFRGGLSGGARVADTVGAGSEGFGKDGRKANGGWEKGAKGLRAGGQRSLMEVWGAKKGGREDGVGKSVDEDVDMAADIKVQSPSAEAEEPDLTTDETPSAPIQTAPPTQIFHNLRFYINGSTAPHISDHKLKHVLAAHGARTSTALGRRTVTHVILGIVNNGHHGGAGGGLAATKIQKEIARTVSKTVKFVTVQWVIQSIKAERRLPESRFHALKLAPRAQGSVFGMMVRSRSSTPTQDKR